MSSEEKRAEGKADVSKVLTKEEKASSSEVMIIKVENKGANVVMNIPEKNPSGSKVISKNENVRAAKDKYQKWISAERIIELSKRFPIEGPKDLTSMKCTTLIKKYGKRAMESNINSAYPVIHESVLKLYEKFLHMNRDDEFYKGMTVAQFVNRLLKKRAVSFSVGNSYYLYFTIDRGDEKESFSDTYVKRKVTSKDGTKYVTHGGTDKWETIGTASEKLPLIRKNCLTYDEIELSSFLSVSSFTMFVNRGSRRNNGVFEENRENVQEKGVIIGLVGPQFVKVGVGEYKRFTEVCHGADNKTGTKMDTLMEKFYDCSDPKIIKVESKLSFNVSAYKKRLAMSFDILLIEANSRAKELGEMAFIHVVGIGLGIWRYCDEQFGIFVDTFYERLEALEKYLSNVSDVRFAYIKVSKSKKRKNVGKISIHFEKVDPHVRIEKGKLLIVSYAYDGNALPGNLFWLGSLSDSSDSAAACSTQIAELHNAYINENVCGENLRIATSDRGVIPYKKYLRGLERGIIKLGSEDVKK